MMEDKSQLNKEERSHLEEVVEEIRTRLEADVRYQLEQNYGLATQPESDEHTDSLRVRLVAVIERERVDDLSWDAGLQEYVQGVGYTIANRLAALRCMEVRGFIDREVTRFRADGLTPAADPLVNGEFYGLKDGVVEAFLMACHKLSEEVQLLFDVLDPYSLLTPEYATLSDVCGLLDKIDDKVWSADDVLGWVYEYYNASRLDELRRKADSDGLDPEDVPAANQFYTPHWVVRMLTDNSLGKLFLEHKGELASVTERQGEIFSPQQRMDRSSTPRAAPTLTELCTYIVPSEEQGEAPEISSPSELRVIDPACGSGHFLLYAFDVLERIWWQERPDLDRSEIPKLILEHNLFGIDIDMRACQLAAFNLYLKARSRAEAEGAADFRLDSIGIVCADSRIADMAGVSELFEDPDSEGGHSALKSSVAQVVEAFEGVRGLGSLLDIRGTLEKKLPDFPLLEAAQENFDPLNLFIERLRETLDEHTSEGFLEKDLRSFLRLLAVMTKEYDVALINPPYGSRGRMPKQVKDYVEENYRYMPEYYVNFIEMCMKLLKTKGRLGMLVPRYFMFKRRYEEFRADFVAGAQGSFDFLAEYGLGILDNATVRTVGSVMRKDASQALVGSFIRLHDLEAGTKEQTFVKAVFGDQQGLPRRLYQVPMERFSQIPGRPLSYWTPPDLLDLHLSEAKLDAKTAEVKGESVSTVATGLQTGNNPRFVRNHWEVTGMSRFRPFAKGGADAWVMPQVALMIDWAEEGRSVLRAPGSVIRNSEFYGRSGLTWTYIKEGGRRFGYFPAGGVFDVAGSMVFPDEISPWLMLTVMNSELYHGLFLSLTPERHWQVGEVSRMPWLQQLSGVERLEQIARKQYTIFLRHNFHNPTSPYYVGPGLLPDDYPKSYFWNQHPHVQLLDEEPGQSFQTGDSSSTLHQLAQAVETKRAEGTKQLENLALEADELIYETLDISQETRSAIQMEIDLRTSGSSGGTPSGDNQSKADVAKYVKELLHHFVLEIVREDEDGVVLLDKKGDQEEPGLLEMLEFKFSQAFREYASERLQEADEALGDRSPKRTAYPNIQRWLKEELFKYHLKVFSNTPIVWLLTTKALVPEQEVEGFGCLVDYHRMDAQLFDRIRTRYLEKRKALLRDIRNSENSPRTDLSLSNSERAQAERDYQSSVNGLRQIEEFETALEQLGRGTVRDWAEAQRALAEQIRKKVRQFKVALERRLSLLDDLFDLARRDWLEDTFSPKFAEKVGDKRDEWISALNDLEEACLCYTKPADVPVDADMADLFHYAEKLFGAPWYSSGGILFLFYYFRKGDKYLGDRGSIPDTLAEEQRLLAELAKGREADISLGQAIIEESKELRQSLIDNWQERAVAEIMTGGYKVIKQHGVALNIRPLAEVGIVPELVKDKVL